VGGDGGEERSGMLDSVGGEGRRGGLDKSGRNRAGGEERGGYLILIIVISRHGLRDKELRT
jgi:hypothetical protein